MTTSQLLSFIRDNIFMISSTRLQDTSLHHVVWCEAQVSLAWAMANISADDRKQLLQEIEDAKVEFFKSVEARQQAKKIKENV